jgi:hypothetical protein
MALPEAVSHLNNALRVLPEIQSEIKRDQLELDVRAALGTAYMAMLGWPAQEVEDTLVPAHGLCRKAARSEHYFTVLWGLWLHHSTYCRFDETSDLFEEMIATGRAQDDSGLVITGMMAACLTYFWMGDFARAADYRDQVLALYDFDQHRHLVAWTNHDPKSTVLAWDTQLRWITGYPDRAEKNPPMRCSLTPIVSHIRSTAVSYAYKGQSISECAASRTDSSPELARAWHVP